MQHQIQIYTSQDGKVSLNVSLDRDTVWLTQAQMAELFNVTPQMITMHLSNVYAEQELDENLTCKEILQVQREGHRDVKRKRKNYNLDAIISVGYRISSKRATQFRQWATQTLKQHLVQGYTLNERRLQERGIAFNQALDLLSRTLSNQALVNNDGKAVLEVVQEYARSWSLLQAYDEQSLKVNPTKQPDMQPLLFDDVLNAIAQLKHSLIEKGEATALFGQLRSDGLASGNCDN